jgi:tetratricopeptide (TPR) repeat protein
MRYLVMAATSWGVAAFQQPPEAESWLDPWWLAGLASVGLLAWRLIVSLYRREEEAAYWVMAASAFAPVSQVFPFIFPMADRYLYPILPGLIGGTLLAARAVPGQLRERWNLPASLRTRAPTIAVTASLVLLVGFAARSRDRAPVFLDIRSMMVESALRYPDGMQGNLLRGQRYAQEGDAAAAAAAIRKAVDLGFDDLQQLLENPGLAAVRKHPDFVETLRHLATLNIARLRRYENPDQLVLMHLGLAYSVVGKEDDAIRTWERALEMGGPFDAAIRQLDRSLRKRSRSDAAPDSPES